ncbi:unnamed protein product [Allacma fusca]|uniref:Uncharacterized protein n=1 Tax=Allacma fusca TaxID=39272 RepID=A0A8J2PNW9_9HEXA|nr:unnamed protein product [Allacma fusca]
MPSCSSIYLATVLMVTITSQSVVLGGTSPVKKRSLIELTEGVDNGDLKLLAPNKRTICNAFTGCPGKRDIIAMKPDYDYDPQGLLESGDDSLDDVSRDILAEARLYEALQARNLMRMSRLNRHQGFFSRQKRASEKVNRRHNSVGPNHHYRKDASKDSKTLDKSKN